MPNQETPRSEFCSLSREEKEQLFLDIIKAPPFATKGTWGEWFHTWLEDQAAEGFPLGAIAARIDLPSYENADPTEAWHMLDRHITWLIDNGFARVVSIRVVA